MSDENTVLILGNGLSRLSFDKEIMSFKGRIWACNRAYLDFGTIITGLAGHIDVMQEAKNYRDEKNQSYYIFGIDKTFTCPEIYQKDTGTTLVAEALTQGKNVIVCGFDLGGLDCYSPGHDKKNKSTWVQRWRLILSTFGADRVTFWGYDHKPFIMSNRPVNEYSRQYIAGKPHIADKNYETLCKEWKGDYSKMWSQVPQVFLRNIGNRDWTFHETYGVLKMGETMEMPECVARKYVELYRKEFIIEPTVNKLV